MILHFLVPNLDVPSLLDGEPTQQWIEDRIHALSNVLQEKAVSIGYCPLNEIKIPKRISHTCHS